MKTKIVGLLGLVGLTLCCADAQVLRISAKIPGDEFFAPYHIIAGEQLANHSIVIEASQEPLPGGNWQFIAGYACYPEDQFVIATFPNRDYEWLPPYAWFRSINNPCASPFAAGFAWPMPGMLPDYLDPKPVLSDGMKSYRATNSHGVEMMIGPEVLPTCTNGVRRFLGVKAAK